MQAVGLLGQCHSNSRAQSSQQWRRSLFHCRRYAGVSAWIVSSDKQWMLLSVTTNVLLSWSACSTAVVEAVC